jgi:transcription antitermination factor NusG
MKEVTAPLFPGYVFCRSEEGNWLPILQAVGVVGIVGIGGRPTPLDEDEIQSIRTAVDTGQEIEPWPYLNVGRVFRISHGAMQGLEGILVRVKDRHRIVLSVNLLQRSVAVEIDPSYVASAKGPRREELRRLAS